MNGSGQVTPSRPAGPSLRDALLVVAVVAADTVLLTRITEDRRTGDVLVEPTLWLALVAGLPLVPALLLRRRAPLLASVAVSAYAVAVCLTIGSRPLLSLLVAWAGVVIRADRRSVVVATVPLVVAEWTFLVYEVLQPPQPLTLVLGMCGFFAVLDLGAWAVARARRSAADEARALRRARDLAAQEAVAHERVRIAHELHDFVAHAVTLMTLQAGAARRTLRVSPDDAEAALRDVELAGRDAVAEMRRLLGVLRSVADPDAAVGAPAQTDPTMRLDALESLAERLASSGLHVRLRRVGSPVRLTPSVELAAYRAVQEGLTNATRHAGPGSSVDVEVRYGTGNVAVAVEDDGAGRPAPALDALSSGLGLVGLRERVKLMGGTLEAGARDGGGFRLHVILPAEAT